MRQCTERATKYGNTEKGPDAARFPNLCSVRRARLAYIVPLLFVFKGLNRKCRRPSIPDFFNRVETGTPSSTGFSLMHVPSRPACFGVVVNETLYSFTSICGLWFSQELNRSLEANKPQLLANLEQAQRDLDAARKAQEEWVPKLEEKVAALMLRLDAGVAAAAAEGETPAQAGTTADGSAASTTGNGGGDGGSSNDQQRGGVGASACSVAGGSAFAAKKPPVTGPGAGKGKGHDGGSGAGGGAEETKGAGGRARAEGSVDDDRGCVRRGSSPLSGNAGGGSNIGGSGSSGKKKGRRRKSK